VALTATNCQRDQALNCVTVDSTIAKKVERQIESCEHCQPADAEIPFDWRLAGVVRFPGCQAIARPVPAIYLTVVNLKRLKPRYLAALKHCERILFNIGLKQNRKPRDVLLIQIHRRVCDPSAAETNAW
jgi:hypothetical protein